MTVANEITTANLVDVAKLIARKEISPVELTEAMLARIAALDGRIRSYLLVTPDLALAQAAPPSRRSCAATIGAACTACRSRSKI